MGGGEEGLRQTVSLGPPGVWPELVEFLLFWLIWGANLLLILGGRVSVYPPQNVVRLGLVLVSIPLRSWYVLPGVRI